jgi:hypothetical protein
MSKKCDPTYKYYYIKVDKDLKDGQAKHSVGRESRGSHQTVKLWLLRNANRF